MAREYTSNINEAIRLLGESRSRRGRRNPILEGIFNNPEEIDEPGYDVSPDISNMGAQGQQMPQQVAPTMKGVFAKIRTEVIKGIAMLAEHPESAEYDALKKILTMVDKPIEVQNPAEQDA